MECSIAAASWSAGSRARSLLSRHRSGSGLRYVSRARASRKNAGISGGSEAAAASPRSRWPASPQNPAFAEFGVATSTIAAQHAVNERARKGRSSKEWRKVAVRAARPLPFSAIGIVAKGAELMPRKRATNGTRSRAAREARAKHEARYKPTTTVAGLALLSPPPPHSPPPLHFPYLRS